MSDLRVVDESWFHEFDEIDLNEFVSISEKEMAQIDADLAHDKTDWHERITLLLWKGEDEIFGDSIGDWPVPAFCDLPEANGLCLRPL